MAITISGNNVETPVEIALREVTRSIEQAADYSRNVRERINEWAGRVDSFWGWREIYEKFERPSLTREYKDLLLEGKLTREGQELEYRKSLASQWLENERRTAVDVLHEYGYSPAIVDGIELTVEHANGNVVFFEGTAYVNQNRQQTKTKPYFFVA